MRKTTLAAVISSVLLGAAAAHANPSQAPEPQPTSQQPAQTSEAAPTGTATSGGNDSVGDVRSNVDEKSSSGSYYPYSSGTVGDDPAKPTSTSTSAPTTGPGEGDQTTATTTAPWMNADSDGDESLSKSEFEKASPTLANRFEEIDVDRDKKLSRDEIRTWHESQKARMDADQGATPPASTAPSTAPNATVPATPAPANVPPASPPPSNDESTTASPDTAGQ
jgi:hypothetical protein